MKRISNPRCCFLITSLAFTGATAQFVPVEPTGLPYHIIVSSVLINGVPATEGTEIGIFDDTLCVGTGIIAEENENIDIVTWEGSYSPYLPGFTAGNPINVKVYVDIYSTMLTLDAQLDFEVGSGLFGSGSYSVLGLAVSTPPVQTQDIPDISIVEDSGPDTTLIALNDHFTHPYGILSFFAMSNDTSAIQAQTLGADTLVLEPQPNWFGAVNIYVGATDGYFNIYDTVLVTVQGVNDVPVITGIPEQNMLEDETLYYTIEVTDVEGDAITLSAESATPEVAVSITGTELEAVPAVNWFGDAEISVNANDGDLESSIEFMLHVQSVDDPPAVVNPVVDLALDEDTPDTVIADLNTVFQDMDQELAYSAGTGNEQLLTITLDGTSAILHCQENAFGSTFIVFTAYNPEQREEVSDTAEVTILPVNDAPESFTLTLLDTVFIDLDNVETDTLALVWDTAADVEEDLLNYHLKGELRALGSDGEILLYHLDTVLTITQLQVAYSQLAELTAAQGLISAELQWDVAAHDGQDSTFSSNGPAVLVVDIQGTILHTDEGIIPLEFALHQNHPNPFNPATTIRFSVERHSNTSLRIFDITGRLVKTLIDEHRTPGEHNITWHAGHLPSGTYFVQMKSGDFVKTRKMVLLK